MRTVESGGVDMRRIVLVTTRCCTVLHVQVGLRRVVQDLVVFFFFFFSSRRRHTRLQGDWSSDVCSSDLQHVLSPLPSLPRIHPVLFAENLSDELLHIPALLELEHVPKPPRLGSHHGFLRSPMAVPAQEYGPVLIR